MAKEEPKSSKDAGLPLHTTIVDTCYHLQQPRANGIMVGLFLPYVNGGICRIVSFIPSN